jgi:deazaflavin-dependent oxidoreductase (nitroreductase family)
MAQSYHVTRGQRTFNSVVIALNRAGVRLGPFALLTIRGRKSGKPLTLPVAPLEYGGKRWLVSPYGTVNWVRNARAARAGTLTRGRSHEIVGLREVPPAESAPVLKAYLARYPRIRPYFDATAELPLAAFTAEAPEHPTFEVLTHAD